MPSPKHTHSGEPYARFCAYDGVPIPASRDLRSKYCSDNCARLAHLKQGRDRYFANKRPKVRRPAKFTSELTASTTPKQHANVLRFAAENHLTLSEAIRVLIERGLHGSRTPTEDSLRRLVR